jgi:pilus assembly protein CpaB
MSTTRAGRLTPIRRRGLLLLCFALVCGGLAASQVRERERRAEAALGPLVSVAVAKRELAADRPLRPGDLTIRRVPARFAPPDALTGSGELAGARPAVPVPQGGYLTSAMLGGGGSRSGVVRPLRVGERALELSVAGAMSGAEPGARVDVLVTAQREDGTGRTFVALEDVELLGLRAGEGEEVPSFLATLRVTARQAVYLTAASNAAGEVRLLMRPPGDRRGIGTSGP